MKVNHNTPIIIIYGATGTGKTEFAEQIAQKTNGVIINMDMGQLYTRLSIGTAKPDWKNSGIEQYLFDIVDQKTHFSAIEYRKKVQELVQILTQEKKTIVIVGGTGFYLYNLVFSNQLLHYHQEVKKLKNNVPQYVQTWEHLNEIDPKRASKIHPNDAYRINRALEIYYETKSIPSDCAPIFDPIYSDIVLINLERSKQELEKRVKQRIDSFLNDGWVEEVRSLIKADWTDFILEKKFIGYPHLIKMLQESNNTILNVKKEIIQATMNYVKRQKTFWRGLCKKIKTTAPLFEQKNITIVEVDLTFTQLDLYLNLFLKKFFSHV